MGAAESVRYAIVDLRSRCLARVHYHTAHWVLHSEVLLCIYMALCQAIVHARPQSARLMLVMTTLRRRQRRRSCGSGWHSNTVPPQVVGARGVGDSAPRMHIPAGIVVM